MSATMDWTRYDIEKALDCIERAQRAAHHKHIGHECEARVEIERAQRFLKNAMRQTAPVAA